MTEFTNDIFGLTFSLPDLTVRQQLRYRSLAYSGMNSGETFTRLWAAAVPLVTGWKCDLLPDPAALDMDEDTNPELARLVMWVGNAVALHVADLDNIEKN